MPRRLFSGLNDENSRRKVLDVLACSPVERRAGLDKVGVHILRHTFCSHLAMQAAAPAAIQSLAGHQSLATTQRYMHLSPASGAGAIALLEKRPPSQGVGDMLETA